VLPLRARALVGARAQATGLEANRGLSTLSVLTSLAALGGAVYLIGFAVAGAFRLIYPYPLEIIEGASLSVVRHLLQGQPAYGAPTLDFVPLVYGPLYFWVAALVAKVLGADFAALRLVSLVASLGSAALVYALVRREVDSRPLGLVAAGIFVGSTPLAIGALDLGRVDALGLFFVLGALYLMRSADFSRRAIWLSAASGGLAGLAIVTKQTQAAVAVALLVYAAPWPRARLLPYAVGLAAVLGIVLLIVGLQSGGWAWFYLIDLPRRHHLQDQYLLNFWPADILPHFTLPLALGPMFFVARAARRDTRAIAFYALALASLLGTAWIARLNLLASYNVLAPAFAILAVMFGLGVGAFLELLERAPRVRGYVLGLCLAQLLILGYNPRLSVPYRSEGWAGDRLVAGIAALPGRVFAPDYGEFAAGAGKGDQPYTAGPMELVGGFGGGMTAVGDQYVAQLKAALSQHQYDYVLLEPNTNAFYLKGAVEGNGYVDAGPLFPPGDQFYLWKTALTPDVHVYVPRPAR
jgi:4-amino-4-deoxy-L-arabinose transferase-like glycosyltransferase